jgi:ABC-type branched-subunit amino acid transport system substrate-binding protein
MIATGNLASQGGSGPGNLDQGQAGANGAIKAINASGGVGPNHQPLQLVTCDDRADPNASATCARNMVSANVAAVIGSTGNYGSSIVPILQAAGIPEVGGLPATAADFTYANSWPVSPIVLAIGTAGGDQAGRLGAKKLSIIRLDSPATASLATQATAGIKPYGGELANNVAVPANAADMSPYAAAATANGADAILDIQASTDMVRFLKALSNTSYKGKVITAATLAQSVINSGFGSALNGVYVNDDWLPPTATSEPGVKKFIDEVKAAGSSIGLSNVVENGWAAAYLFAAAANKVTGTVDAASISKAMPTITAFNDGLQPTVDFSMPINTFGPTFHVFNPYAIYEIVKDGQLTIDGSAGLTFYNVLAPTQFPATATAPPPSAG